MNQNVIRAISLHCKNMNSEKQKKTNPILQDIQKIKQTIPEGEFVQKKCFNRKKLFVGTMVSLLATLVLAASVMIILAHRNKKTVMDFGRTILNEDLQFIREQRYIFFPSILQSDDSAEQIAENTNDKKKIPGEIIEESSSIKKSKNNDWWLNSGGVMYMEKKDFSTNLGPLEKNSFWRKLYSNTNSKDTDKGYFPQNIFRLVTKNKWKNFSQSVYFNIEKINLSDSSNRNESNGILLFNRYQDGDNLYYVGLRVDGHAVIKKKIDGKYYTMSDKKIFDNTSSYDRDKNPNSIPLNEWIGIKSEVETNEDNSVIISLFTDQNTNGWQLVMKMTDKDDKYGPTPLMDSGHAGIRTDFMDVHFRDYKVEELK